MRAFYTAVFSALLPLVLLRLWWRGFRAPAYRERWLERLGFYEQQSAGRVVWFHAVSVGEAEAIFPLVKLMQAEHPEMRFLVTTTTPTGSMRVKAVLQDSVEHVYLPYDIPWIIQRFLKQFQPRLAVFVEKEVWPNLFFACRQQSIPLYIINARLSAQSAPAYRKIPKLIEPALNCADLIAAQTEDDARRFVEIGARSDQVQVLGNIKFDMQIDAGTAAAGMQMKVEQFDGRFVWIVASTHQGEEAVFLKLYQQLKTAIPELLLLIAPRHPERFQAVKVLCDAQSLTVALRSSGQPCTRQTDVYLADSMGELKMLYAAADVAFVGGSLVPVGGHNILEPAALGIPVMFGPYMFNFAEIARQVQEADAAIQCPDEQAITDTLLALSGDAGLRTRLAEKGRAFVSRNQGATRRVADLLSSHC